MRSRDVPSSKTTAINEKTEREQVEVLAEEEDDVEAERSPGGAGIMVKAPSTDGELAKSGEQSPKKKRSRDQFDKDHTAEGEPLVEDGMNTALPESNQLNTADKVIPINSNSDKGEPEKKRHRDFSNEGTEVAEAESVPVSVWTSFEMAIVRGLVEFVQADFLSSGREIVQICRYWNRISIWAFSHV